MSAKQDGFFAHRGRIAASYTPTRKTLGDSYVSGGAVPWALPQRSDPPLPPRFPGAAISRQKRQLLTVRQEETDGAANNRQNSQQPAVQEETDSAANNRQHRHNRQRRKKQAAQPTTDSPAGRRTAQQGQEAPRQPQQGQGGNAYYYIRCDTPAAVHF